MQVEVISANELDAALTSAWRQFQAADPDLQSAFFTPEFCRTVAEVRDDLRIAVITEGGGTVGFFPYHRQRFGRLAPLGGELSDYHGIIGRRGAVKDFRRVLRPLAAQAYDFNHTPVSQAAFESHAYLVSDSPRIDLAEGYDAWRAAKRRTTRAFREIERRTRKAEREIGPIRLADDAASDSNWQHLVDWKRAALAERGYSFVLDKPWARAIVDRVRHSESAALSGTMPALWIGDELAAVQLSIRSGTTAHEWFASYNPKFARYSPGLILLDRRLKQACDSGVTEVDLGRGDERYKKEFSNTRRLLYEGSVERALSPLGLTRRLRKKTERVVARTESEALAEFSRRAANRLLLAGRLT